MNFKVKDVAKIIGVSDQYIRIGLQKNIFTFGEAVLNCNGKYSYLINSEKFIKFLLSQNLIRKQDKYNFNKSLSRDLNILKRKLIKFLEENNDYEYKEEINLLKAILDYEKVYNN